MSQRVFRGLLLLCALSGCADRGECVKTEVLGQFHHIPPRCSLVPAGKGLVPVWWPARWEVLVRRHWTKSEPTEEWVDVGEAEYRRLGGK